MAFILNAHTEGCQQLTVLRPAVFWEHFNLLFGQVRVDCIFFVCVFKERKKVLKEFSNTCSFHLKLWNKQNQKPHSP